MEMAVLKMAIFKMAHLLYGLKHLIMAMTLLMAAMGMIILLAKVVTILSLAEMMMTNYGGMTQLSTQS